MTLCNRDSGVKTYAFNVLTRMPSKPQKPLTPTNEHAQPITIAFCLSWTNIKIRWISNYSLLKTPAVHRNAQCYGVTCPFIMGISKSAASSIIRTERRISVCSTQIQSFLQNINPSKPTTIIRLLQRDCADME